MRQTGPDSQPSQMFAGVASRFLPQRPIRASATKSANARIRSQADNEREEGHPGCGRQGAHLNTYKYPCVAGFGCSRKLGEPRRDCPLDRSKIIFRAGDSRTDSEPVLVEFIAPTNPGAGIDFLLNGLPWRI